MREIKFRAWDKNQNIMLIVRSINIKDDIVFVYGQPFGYFLKNMELMQFTGLQDKNGVDIYEGDIWKPNILSKTPIVVKYGIGKFNIADFEINGLWEYSDRGAVIGNIYENADLLE